MSISTENFSEVLLSDNEQSVDEHMVKLKGRSGMKQYIKSKPMKWGFKFWFRCSNKTGDLYQMGMYLGKKQSSTFNLDLGEKVVLQLTTPSEKSFCIVYFDNVFNSPTLVKKLFEKSIYAIGTVRSNRKQMPKMTDDKKMKRGDSEFLFSN